MTTLYNIGKWEDDLYLHDLTSSLIGQFNFLKTVPCIKDLVSVKTYSVKKKKDNTQKWAYKKIKKRRNKECIN